MDRFYQKYKKWGLGIVDWAQSPIPNPQSPIPNPHIYFIILKIVKGISNI